MGVGPHCTGRVAQRACRAHAGDGVARRLSQAAGAPGPADQRERRLLRLQPGPGQRRGPPAPPDQRLPCAGQWRHHQPHNADANQQARCQGSCPGPGHRVHRGRHPQRPVGTRPHLRHRQRAGHALLGRRQNRHQQRHARQLGAGLVAALHRGRVGGQCQRRADVGCERHYGRRADLGCGHALPACQATQPRAQGTAGRSAGACAVCQRRRQPGGRAQRMVYCWHAAIGFCYEFRSFPRTTDGG